MKTVRIGGVPEHFNYAWYLGLKNKAFRTQGINLRWTDCHGGTGEMVQGLEDNSIDLAVVLTEGIVKAITDGNQSKIVQTFVKSPLVWGIHVAESSTYLELYELKNKTAAISRIGSGSHLMAYVNAQKLGWNTENDLKFKLVKNLEGGIRTLSEREADYFMWEKFTTKPLVDNKIFRRIGECPTPWPCFVIAARNEFINKEPELLYSVLEIINKITKDFKSIPEIDKIISKRYAQKQKDVQAWLGKTEWSQQNIDEKTIEAVQQQLMALDIIEKKLSYSELVHSL
jgi:ABC-type nitrate/sulfonate/bicarbonate transport system substrate-binding protein